MKKYMESMGREESRAAYDKVDYRITQANASLTRHVWADVLFYLNEAHEFFVPFDANSDWADVPQAKENKMKYQIKVAEMKKAVQEGIAKDDFRKAADSVTYKLSELDMHFQRAVNEVWIAENIKKISSRDLIFLIFISNPFTFSFRKTIKKLLLKLLQ